MAEKIEFLDYEERIIRQIHGVKGDDVGLRAKITHRIILPKRAPNTSEHIVVFYCNAERLRHLKNSAKVFGDSDFTKSISRFITAGEHYMGEEVSMSLFPTSEVLKVLWSRLISKLVPKWMSRK